MKKLTDSQSMTLISALIFKGVPVVYNASATALKKDNLLRTSRIGNLILTEEGRVIAKKLLKNMVSKLVLMLVLFVSQAQADSQVVLTQGQCTQVDGQNYCWYYRPTTWDHPDQPPLPCDFRKDCPLTLLIPTSANSPNMVSGGMAQALNQRSAQNNGAMRFCRERGEDDFVLVQVEVKNGKKNEIVLNEYKDDESKCMRDEQRLSGGESVPTAQVAQNGGAIIVDTYRAPSPCPYTQRTYINNGNTVKARDVLRKFKKIF